MAVTALLTPDARLRILSDLGVVVPGAKLNTYVAGTPSTPLATTSDSAGLVPNTNPVVASAGGLFGPIYLTPGVAYKLVLTDALNGPIWSQDNVMMPANNTLAAGTGISIATVAGVTTITASGSGGVVLAADGTVAAPGLSFVNEPDCGIYRDGTNGLGVATNGNKALGLDATGCLDFPLQPRCVAYHNTTQSLADATVTALLLNSEDVDVQAMHDLVTNNSRVTIPAGADGFFKITGFAEIAYNVTGLRRLAIRKNGTTNLAQVEVGFSSNGSLANQGIVTPTIEVALVATDYVELTAYQNAGGALQVGNATRSNSTTLTVRKVA